MKKNEIDQFRKECRTKAREASEIPASVFQGSPGSQPRTVTGENDPIPGYHENGIAPGTNDSEAKESSDTHKDDALENSSRKPVTKNINIKDWKKMKRAA